MILTREWSVCRCCQYYEDEDVIVTVKSKDYAFNSKYISSDDSYFHKPADLDFEMQAIEEGKSFRINNIYFKTDAFELNNKPKMYLEVLLSSWT